MSRQMAYKRRKADPDFAAAWDEAIEGAVDDLVADVWKRATGPEASDRLAVFLLQAHRPGVYGKRVDKNLSGEMVIEVRYVDRPEPECQAAAVGFGVTALGGPSGG